MKQARASSACIHSGNSFKPVLVDRTLSKNLPKHAYIVVSRNGERIPRPLSTGLQGKRANEVVHVDYLYMGTAEQSSLEHMLVVRNDISSYTWLQLCVNSNSDAEVSTIAKWISCFAVIVRLVTDQGSHFKASLMKGLASETHIRHHFTTACCPRANGTVERLRREVLRIMRAVLSGWKLSVGKWPKIVESIQRVLNQSPMEHLGKDNDGKMLCPMKVFTKANSICPSCSTITTQTLL